MMNKQKKNGFYSKLELAMELRICTRTLEKLMREGQISYLKVKNRVIFSQEDIDAFVERTRREAFGINEESLKRYLN
jgi:predicted site-specific integrase-resolvase